ncbi:MAG: hypothetical protein KUG73_01195 [Pseudomonadales bacterium]|nr:hypothetical protein [Pseudomonadales bacterium]
MKFKTTPFTCRKHITLCLLFFIINSVSCGYLLHPKRLGQTKGNIDPVILVLDAAGLLIGILPGVVAFAVDITTGTIYLSPGEPSILDTHKKRLTRIPYNNSLSNSIKGVLPISYHREATLNIQRPAIARQLSALLGKSLNSDNIRFYIPTHHTIIVSASKNHLNELKTVSYQTP